jgi:membrane-bound lytic murein transglycosylase MltF
MLRRLLLAALLLMPTVAFAQGEDSDEEPSTIGEELLAIVNDPWIGDWDGIRDRRQLRVLITYNRTNFLIEAGQGRGLEYEAMMWLQDYVNARNAPGGPANLRVFFVPLPFDELIPALLDGRGDMIAAGMTATEERAQRVLFTEPYIRNVSEVVVAHKDAPALASAEDLAGRTVVVKRGTSYIGSLRALNERLKASGRPEVKVVVAPGHLETEDLIEMVNAGIIRYTIADHHLAEAWDRILPDIAVLKDVAVAGGRNIAWAVRPDATGLKALLDRFIEEKVRKDRATALTIFRRYFENTRFLDNPAIGLDARDRAKLLAPHFRDHAEKVGFDWLLMLSQGFQESKLDARARSHVGAVGVMQLMPATGREMGVRDLTHPEQNISGGIRYMERLRSTYFNDPAIPPEVQVQFALAGYNAGPNRINRLRQEAAKQGLDPNRWFGHVERVVQQKVGSEPVRYVANIFAYYVTYTNALDLMGDRAEELQAFREALGAAAP